MMPRLRSSPNGNAGQLAAALKGRRQGRGWIALCPAHKEKTPSLKIDESRDGRVLVHCFGGCDQQTVISVLRERGLWGDEQRSVSLSAKQIEKRKRDDEKRTAERLSSVAGIWSEAQNPQGTLAEQYLSSRCLNLPRELCGNHTEIPSGLPVGERCRALLARCLPFHC